MSAQQLLLNLPKADGFGRADFLPASSNTDALEALSDWRSWTGDRMLLVGPAGSGRTHLLHIWARETGGLFTNGRGLTERILDAELPAVAVDDADHTARDPIRQELLFHLINAAQSENRPLLLSARNVPGTWGLSLPDLESRLQTFSLTRVHAPDEALMEMVLVKLCHDRQLAVGPETISFLASRLDRSLALARRVIETLDRTALTRQCRVTRPLAAEVLGRLQPERSGHPDPTHQQTS